MTSREYDPNKADRPNGHHGMDTDRESDAKKEKANENSKHDPGDILAVRNCNKVTAGYDDAGF